MEELSLIQEQYLDSSDAVTLITVFRDELLLLPYFIEYYQNRGVDNFMLVDNNSVDSSSNFLTNLKNVNLTLFYTSHSYKSSKFGTNWVNAILNRYCKNKWCIVVDIDELLNVSHIKETISILSLGNYNLQYYLLLDMYPRSNKKKYLSGSNFLKHSNYYDKYSPHSIRKKTLPNNALQLKGGVRERVFDIQVCISKVPLFNYDFYDNFKIGIGCHLLSSSRDLCIKDPNSLYVTPKIRIYPKLGILLHFKFLKPHILEFFLTRIRNNQDWDNSNEYRTYVDNFKQSLYSSNHSVHYQTLDIIEKDYAQLLMM